MDDQHGKFVCDAGKSGIKQDTLLLFDRMRRFKAQKHACMMLGGRQHVHRLLNRHGRSARLGASERHNVSQQQAPRQTSAPLELCQMSLATVDGPCGDHGFQLPTCPTAHQASS